MVFLKKIIILLKKPFPEVESMADYFLTVAAVGIFVTFFLYIFKPFDISTLESNQFWVCLSFGAVTFVAILFYDFIIGPLLRLKVKGKQYTFGKWIINMTGIMLTISVGNFLFIRLSYFGYINWEFLPHMIRSTFAIGIFPVVTIGAISLLRQEKKFQHIAEEINQKPRLASLRNNASNKFIFGIPTDQVRYVEALQNYVKIGYLNADGQLTEQTERATLKGILDEQGTTTIVRCHRSYLVNPDAIVSTSGNAQGLLLSLENCEKEIPVSRSYVPAFRGV